MTSMALVLESMMPITLTAPPDFSEEQFFKICDEFPDDKVEYNAREGIVTVMPPTDPETGSRHSLIIFQFVQWQKSERRGKVADSSAGFRFDDGSRMSPDASWFDHERWKQAQEPGTRFPVFAPEFVIELRSPSDRLLPLREKMDVYLRSGVRLAWLIDPQQRTVTIYQPGSEPVILQNPSKVHGEGPIGGFVMNLDGIL